MYIIHTHTDCISSLERGESLCCHKQFDRRKQQLVLAAAFFFLLNYTRAQSLCRRGCHFAQNDQFKCVKCACRYLHLSAFCAAFYLYVWFVGRTLFLFSFGAISMDFLSQKLCNHSVDLVQRVFI